MLWRAQRGEVPRKHHIAFRDADGRLRHEECFTRAGFDGPYTIAYHRNRPHAQHVAEARRGGKADDLWAALARDGFIGVCLPEQYGGGGLGVTGLAVVCEEVAAVGTAPFLLVVSPGICGSILARFGTADQKERWLPPIAAGELKMGFAITEPDAGSNSHNLSTTAARDGECWRSCFRCRRWFGEAAEDSAGREMGGLGVLSGLRLNWAGIGSELRRRVARLSQSATMWPALREGKRTRR